MDATTYEKSLFSGRTDKAAERALKAARPAEPRANPVVRHRVSIGSAQVEHRDFPVQKGVPVRVGGAHVVLIVALAGELDIVGAASRVTVRPGAAVLLVRNEPVIVVGLTGADLLLVRLARRELHIMASEAYGGGRRVSTAAPWMLSVARDGRLWAILEALQQIARPDAAEAVTQGVSLCVRLHRAVLEGLAGCGPIDEVLPLSRAVTEAMRQVHDRPDEDWTLPRLAAAVAVTSGYLQRSFRDHLGKGVAGFILEARLHKARASLSTAHDSRPMSVIASSLGFKRPASFSRAYVRMFGETPSETRARAVRMQSIDG